MKVSQLITRLTEFLSENEDIDVILSIKNDKTFEHLFSDTNIELVDYEDGTLGLYAHKEVANEEP